MAWAALLLASFGAAVLALSVVGARRPTIPAFEQRVFRAVNRLPDWLYWPLWPPMQLGNLVVGTLAGVAVAAYYESWTMASAAVLAAVLKLVVERVIRHWTRDLLTVRRRPGTSEPGAIVRGRDVPHDGPSFPSGHAMLAAAIACIVTVKTPGAADWIPFVLTFLVMFGRVYVGAHNPLDVTAGLGLGLAVGALAIVLVYVPHDEVSHWTDEQHARVDSLIDEYRQALHDSLDDLTEDEARRRLVPSKTTLLGLVKHATFVEGVWFDQAVTGRAYEEIGIATTVDGSFTLRPDDTIASVQAAYRERWEASRHNLAGLRSDDVVDGRGARPVWALELQVLRELAQHSGHADILREQILAGRAEVNRRDGGGG